MKLSRHFWKGRLGIQKGFFELCRARVYNSTMPYADCLHAFRAGNAQVEVYPSADECGAAAAEAAAQIIAQAVKESGVARVIGATGNSQIPVVDALVKKPLRWEKVELFHMDEYVGIGADHPASFRRWIKERFADKVHPRETYYLVGDAADLAGEMERYTQLLSAGPIDLAFVGFGENGHIAFNDPHVADFNDPLMVKEITLDAACRRQQAGEGHFPDVESVPNEAMTITCTGLFRAKAWVCCVPDARKAIAVRNALEGAIEEACPASLVRRHPGAQVFLDRASAALVSNA